MKAEVKFKCLSEGESGSNSVRFIQWTLESKVKELELYKAKWIHLKHNNEKNELQSDSAFLCHFRFYNNQANEQYSILLIVVNVRKCSWKE